MPAEVNEETCTGCESCVSECPSDAISVVDGKAQIKADSCVDCGVCIDACPVEAITL